jgi:hypothetical protein
LWENLPALRLLGGRLDDEAVRRSARATRLLEKEDVHPVARPQRTEVLPRPCRRFMFHEAMVNIE